MKKLLSLLLIVLLMFSVLFVTVSCKDQPAAEEPQKQEEIDPTGLVKYDPILPKGTGQFVPSERAWSVDPNGVTGLPNYIVNFKGSAKASSITNVTTELKNAIKKAMTDHLFDDKPVNNVILIIGDGMGKSHLDISREYKGELIMDSLPYFNYARHQSYNKEKAGGTGKITTDSCAGGTQILTGYKTRYGYIATDINQNPVTTLTELAKSKNWKTATVTNDWISDATPADTLVHCRRRSASGLIYFQELMNMPDLLMGWDGHMEDYINDKTWAQKLAAAELGALADGTEEEWESTKITVDGVEKNKESYMNEQMATKGAIEFLHDLEEADRNTLLPYSIYYYIWNKYSGHADDATFTDFYNWVKSPTGLKAFTDNLDIAENDPVKKINQFSNFTDLMANTDTSYVKNVLGSWTEEGANYDSARPNRGYWQRLTQASLYPSFPEMVAYTLYQMDKESTANDTGFFCMIENTCTDGWGHSHNSDIKVIGVMNEVQCFDEGVAIAVKYVLEHPDTLLIVTADHETGKYMYPDGWKDDPTLIYSDSTGHSDIVVPAIAFGAGADRFSAAAIKAAYPNDSWTVNETLEYEGWITGQIIGQLMGDEDFGQYAGYPNPKN